MKLSTEFRRSRLRLALMCIMALGAGLALPVSSTASQAGSRAEERAAQTEERAQERTVRTEERTARAQEREARRTGRSEERSDRHDAPKVGGEASGEAGEAGAGPSSPSSGSGVVRGCRISIQTSTGRVVAGESVTVSGTLECPHGASVAGQQISIYAHQGGVGVHGFGPAGTASPGVGLAGTPATQTDGSYELTSAALYTNTVFQVRFGRRHARAAVKVAPLVTLAAAPAEPFASSDAQTAASGSTHQHARTEAAFTGTVSPVVTGARVALQIAHTATGAHWRTIAHGIVGADGSFSIAHPIRIPGATSVRAVVRTGRQNVAGISEPVSFAATQPQNPQLTIETSADPLAYGQQVTIGGVAAGAGEQTVTLLARTKGSAFQAVASATTNATGEYTFTQEPLQNTCYQVTDATARSTVVYEGVAFALVTETTPSAAQVGQPATFTGTLTGAPEGQVVDLERGYGSGLGFHVVAAGTVNATSQYQVAYTFARKGTYMMRVKASGDGVRQTSASTPFTVTVTG